MSCWLGSAALLCVVLCRVINMASVSELLGPILYTRTIDCVSTACGAVRAVGLQTGHTRPDGAAAATAL